MGIKIKSFFRRIRIPRTTVLSLVFLLMSYILIHQLFELQIIQGEDYISKFQTRTTKTRVMKSTRGNIYDRNGELIASNVLSYSLTFEDNGSYETTREKNLTLNGVAYQVLKILEENGDSISVTFHIGINEGGDYAFDVGEGFTLNRFRADIYGHPLIDDLKEEERTATAEEMIAYLSGSKRFCVVLEGENAYTPQELEAHHLPQQLDKPDILNISILRYALSTNSFKKYMPVTIATNVSEKSVAAIMENSSQLQGIDVVEDSVRQYIDEESMAPILGYTGKASAEELKDLRKSNPDYANDAIVGKAGLEQYLELTLQGTDGIETVSVDNLGKVLKIDENTRILPEAGDDVTITIDSHWQAGIYEILKQRVAGILLAKIFPGKTFDFDQIESVSQIEIPMYDVYNALISNSVININLFDEEDASDLEKSIYAKFLKKQEQVFGIITDRLTGDASPALEDEDPQIQEYLTYIVNDLLQDRLGILAKTRIDTSDATYRAWDTEQSISMKDYLIYATGQNWIDLAQFSPEGDYLDSAEVYTALTEYILDFLRTDTSFSKILYKYMLQEDTLSGQEVCLVLYEQGILSKEDSAYEALAGGSLTSYNFMVQKIANLEIEPAQLALEPCSASCVVTDVKTGEVLACVSYPGYDNNRLTNNMDTTYYTKLALDQSSPFFNKATQQTTMPGSTIKLLSTIVGMGEGIIDENTYINCTGKFDYVEPPINCWNTEGHADIEIRTAIEQSCNYFFNMIGFQAGKTSENRFSENTSLSRLQQYASYMGLDKKTGIQITEAAPHVSDSLAVPSYMGQGNHLYTTTELARYASVLASSGTVRNLTLLKNVKSPSGELIETYEGEVINEMNVDDTTWSAIHDGMERVVATHEQFDTLSMRMTVAGKTGTAEVDRKRHPNHALFIGYAPAADPQYAIAIRIANGYSSGNACLAASDVFHFIFNLVDENEIITGYASSDTSEVTHD